MPAWAGAAWAASGSLAVARWTGQVPVVYLCEVRSAARSSAARRCLPACACSSALLVACHVLQLSRPPRPALAHPPQPHLPISSQNTLHPPPCHLTCRLDYLLATGQAQASFPFKTVMMANAAWHKAAPGYAAWLQEQQQAAGQQHGAGQEAAGNHDTGMQEARQQAAQRQASEQRAGAQV